MSDIPGPYRLDPAGNPILHAVTGKPIPIDSDGPDGPHFDAQGYVKRSYFEVCQWLIACENETAGVVFQWGNGYVQTCTLCSTQFNLPLVRWADSPWPNGIMRKGYGQMPPRGWPRPTKRKDPSKGAEGPTQEDQRTR